MEVHHCGTRCDALLGVPAHLDLCAVVRGDVAVARLDFFREGLGGAGGCEDRLPEGSTTFDVVARRLECFGPAHLSQNLGYFGVQIECHDLGLSLRGVSGGTG